MSEPLLNEPLLNELRAARPTAPAGLRERVRTIAAQEPARAPFLAPASNGGGSCSSRRRRLVVALAAAGVIGLTRGDVDRSVNEAASSPEAPDDARLLRAARRVEDADALERDAAGGRGEAAPGSAGTVAPTPGQLQRYEAELSLRVEDVEGLSDATKQAQRIALQHGGSVASLRYDAPAEGAGAAQITLRIPTAPRAERLAELSQLGTIIGQSYGIEDLQPQADSLQTQIEQTQRRIAQILTQLENSTLSAEERAVLQSRLTGLAAEAHRPPRQPARHPCRGAARQRSTSR